MALEPEGRAQPLDGRRRVAVAQAGDDTGAQMTVWGGHGDLRNGKENTSNSIDAGVLHSSSGGQTDAIKR
ncbi:hypothetical protein D3C80_1604850 [compost metagenome]